MSSNLLLLKLRGKLTWSFFNEHIIIKDNQWGKEPWTNGVLENYHLLVYAKDSNPSRKSNLWKHRKYMIQKIWLKIKTIVNSYYKIDSIKFMIIKTKSIKLISSPKIKSIYTNHHALPRSIKYQLILIRKQMIHSMIRSLTQIFKYLFTIICKLTSMQLSSLI